MPKTGRSATCAEKLKVLSDETRLSVMRELMHGPRSVSQLNRRLRLEQSLLSHHLQILRAAGFVAAHREGRSVRYALAPDIASGPKDAINLGCCHVNFARGAESPPARARQSRAGSGARDPAAPTTDKPDGARRP